VVRGELTGRLDQLGVLDTLQSRHELTFIKHRFVGLGHETERWLYAGRRVRRRPGASPGSARRGRGGDALELTTVEFGRLLSGRGKSDGLLSHRVVF